MNNEQAFPGEGPITGGPKCTVEPLLLTVAMLTAAARNAGRPSPQAKNDGK